MNSGLAECIRSSGFSQAMCDQTDIWGDGQCPFPVLVLFQFATFSRVVSRLHASRAFYNSLIQPLKSCMNVANFK